MTNAPANEVKTLQSRPLDTVHPIICLNCIQTKVCEDAEPVETVYLAPGTYLTGDKEIFGSWTSQNEGAEFWLQVVTERRNRGVQDILIVCIDILKCFLETIEAALPSASV